MTLNKLFQNKLQYRNLERIEPNEKQNFSVEPCAVKRPISFQAPSFHFQLRFASWTDIGYHGPKFSRKTDQQNFKMRREDRLLAAIRLYTGHAAVGPGGKSRNTDVQGIPWNVKKSSYCGDLPIRQQIRYEH